MNNTNVNVDIYVPEGCLSCKYFKYHYYIHPLLIELKCKKGDKSLIAGKPFACGEYKQNKKFGVVKYEKF